MNRSDIVDQVLLSQLPDNVFMRGQEFGALPDDTLGFAWGSMFSKIGGGLAKAGTAAASFAPKALPKLIDVGSQFAQFKMQKDLAKSQAAAQNAYNAAASASNVSVPGSFNYSSTTPGSNPYSQPTSSSFMTQQVAGIPVWALGAGAVGLIALVMILKRK